jgi:YgiT-type zinc finger domain-containing protein
MIEPAGRPMDSCPECQVGALQPRTVPYYAALRGMLITIPYFPAWVCDVCRHCEYDENAVDELRAILGPSADLPVIPVRRRRVTAENLPPWARPDTRKGSK